MPVVLVALVVVLACGRYGFDPQVHVGGTGDAAGDGISGDAIGRRARWLTSCAAGDFTCCTQQSRTCVQSLQQCASGNVAQCDPNPPYTPCGLGEICCIIAPETYLR